MQFFLQQFNNNSMVSNEDMNNNNNNNQKSRQVSIVDDGPLRIHIGNIPFSWSDKHLREQFEIFGPVDDVEVVSNAQGSKGFGFLTFMRRRDGERAMQVKNGTIADGRKITASLAVAKNHTTPPPTPARTAFGSLSTNRPMPALTNPSPLSPDAPMWMPVTPPSSLTTNWRLSPEVQSNVIISASPPLSSSPLSTLLPPSQTRVEWLAESENVKHHWHQNYHKKNCCKHCPHCGRSVY